jgi:hypothetical protein
VAYVGGFVGMCVCSSLDHSGYELGCRINGCMGSCSSNAWWAVYPHYGNGCSGNGANTTPCSKQTALPQQVSCLYFIDAEDVCNPGNWFGGNIWSLWAGPSDELQHAVPRLLPGVGGPDS